MWGKSCHIYCISIYGKTAELELSEVRQNECVCVCVCVCACVRACVCVCASRACSLNLLDYFCMYVTA